MKKGYAIGWIFVFVFMCAVCSCAVESDVDMLLNLLVEKQVLTEADAEGFRTDLQKAKQEEKKKQSDFQVSTGRDVKFSGYTQPRYRIRNGSSSIDTFDIRRARLDIRGMLTSRYDYRTQIEFGGANGPFLLDATVVAKFSPSLNMTLGQFKVPLSRENLMSSAKLETIYRSQAVEALTSRGRDVLGNNNGRDIGLAFSGRLAPGKDDYLFDYSLGIFNGAGINTSDKNEQKDIAARLIYHPCKKFEIGGSYLNGRGNWGTPATNKNRDRFGLDFNYQSKPLNITGEYISGKDDTTRKDGWYIQLGYFFKPDKLQGVMKFDTYDPNTKASADETDVYTFGLNRFFNKWTLLQVNYEFKREKGTEIDNDALTGQFTFKF